MARPGTSTSWAVKGVHFVAELIAAAEFEILVGGVTTTHSLTNSHDQCCHTSCLVCRHLLPYF